MSGPVSSPPAAGSRSASAPGTDGGPDPGVRSYHGQPVLKEPVWTWEIPFYFFTGGMAGASAGLAFLSGLRGNDVLARRAWAAAGAAGSVSPVLLTADLGRPERFLNMLRMFKVTSPMSVGSWLLTAELAVGPVAAIHAWTGRFPRAAKLAGPVAALLGCPLSTYTAALVANTAIPVWHEARTTLPFVFGAGAALSAGAAAVVLTPPEHAAPARRLALGAALVEAGAREVMERRLGEHAEPYSEGPAARFRMLGRACVVAGASLLAGRGRSSWPASVAAGALLASGALTARWAIFKAGVQSASDPKYVIRPQRAGIERGERRGASRRRPRQ